MIDHSGLYRKQFRFDNRYKFETAPYDCPLNRLYGPEFYFLVHLPAYSSAQVEAVGVDGQDVALYTLNSQTSAEPIVKCSNRYREDYGDMQVTGNQPEKILLRNATPNAIQVPLVVDSADPMETGYFDLTVTYDP